MRQDLHSNSARREFSDRADHFWSPHPPERAVSLDYILPPACHPEFLPGAALEKRALLETSSSHRFSFDGSSSLFCVAFQCSPHVKGPSCSRCAAAPRTKFRLRGKASISRRDIRAGVRWIVSGYARKPMRRGLSSVPRLLRRKVDCSSCCSPLWFVAGCSSVRRASNTLSAVIDRQRL